MSDDLARQVAVLENAIKPMMTREALTRYGTIKLVHPDKAVHALVVFAQMAQSGKLTSIDDAALKDVLIHLNESPAQHAITR